MLLNNSSTASGYAAMSDGVLVDDSHGERRLCESCGAVYVIFDPENWLDEYYRTTYDISDKVQSPPVVIDGKVVFKHDMVLGKFFSYINNRYDASSQGSFLEISCANGKLSESFAQYYRRWDCIGLDPSSSAGNLIQSENATFIRDYYRGELFQDALFDVITTHGYTHISGYSGLKSIRGIIKDGGILSVEYMALEDSQFTPYTWDHPVTMVTQVLEEYIRSAGFTIREKLDCISAKYLICEATHAPKTHPGVGGELVSYTKTVIQQHIYWWQSICNSFLEHKDLLGDKIALFGAGIYSAVLVSLLGQDKFFTIIDEGKEGAVFAGSIPVISLSHAGKDPQIAVFLCCRPAYAGTIKNKIVAAGIKNHVVPEALEITATS